jgi:hypothetical protein
MKHSIAVGTVLAAALLAGSAAEADKPKSGPQVGERIPGPFNPLNINGEDAGQKRCQV